MIPHVVAHDWSSAAASRWSSILAACPIDEAEIAIIGLPDDTGVQLNGGRVGASGGPAALRAALLRYGVREPSGWTWPRVCDVGNVAPGRTLDETHARVTEAVSALVGRGIVPIALGGGHDLTFPFVRAVAQEYGPMHGVYFDAHLDVRAEQGSGMPFRRLIEAGHVKHLDILGFDRFANAREHVAYFTDHRGRINERRLHDDWPDEPTFVSLDLDVLDASIAPGVSAMNPSGWSAAEAEAWVNAAGRAPHVRCFDIMELNPLFDEGGRTARVAARLLLAFLAGFAERTR